MKAPVAFHLVGVGVDGEHLVPKLTQAPIHRVGSVGLGFPRNARDGNTLLSEKFKGGVLDGHSRRYPCKSATVFACDFRRLFRLSGLRFRNTRARLRYFPPFAASVWV
jgi:hypothetical protein